MKTPLFQIVGGFANDNYWSSSEFDNNNAWNQNFNNGNQNDNNKNNTLRVRAVRGFKQNQGQSHGWWIRLPPVFSTTLTRAAAITV